MKTKAKPATVRGIHASDHKAMGQTNSAATETVAEGFTLDENDGIVKFQGPVFKWSSGLVVEPTLYLRCLVYGDRYDKQTKNAGGPFGVEAIDCSHLILKYQNGVPQNKTDVDRKIALIFATKLKDYEPADSGSRSYIGLMDFELDGKCPQITWSVGPQGATTQASQSSEHNPWVPSEVQRRAMELQAIPKYEDADDDF
jgi:hypothetical protein